MYVIVDSQEPDHIKNTANVFFEEVTVEPLPVYDFICGNVGIERKTVRDFCSSIYDGRLFRQAKNMSMNLEKSCIIIVGTQDDLWKSKPRYTVDEFLGAQASVYSNFGVPCLMCDNHQQFFKYTRAIFHKAENGNKHPETVLKKHSNKKNVELNMLCCVPGIGVKKAKKILAEYKPRDLFELSKKDLKQIDGIGETHAKNIKKYFK